MDHLVEHLILNGNRGLKNQSETPIETSHHIERDDRRDLARKDCLEHNAFDVMTKKWIASDPGVRSIDAEVTKKIVNRFKKIIPVETYESFFSALLQNMCERWTLDGVMSTEDSWSSG